MSLVPVPIRALAFAPLLALAGCDALSGGPDLDPVASPVAPASSAEGQAAGGQGATARAGGKPPLYVVLYTHHYLGLGGYYPTAAQVRAVAEACVEADMVADCVLHFDGILVDRLEAEDASLDDYLQQHRFPIGYHGEEAHGPYPVVVSVQRLNRSKDEVTEQGVVVPGTSFDQAVEVIRQRYTHGFSGPRVDAQGYLSRQSGGASSSRSGGIARVEAWTGADPQIVPGHALFQPAATLAFEAEADIALLQAAGPFAPHFLKNTKDPELMSGIAAFLGEEDTLFWYMGQLAEKGSESSMLPMWNTANLVQKAGKGGVDSRGYLGLHLLPGPLLAWGRQLLAQVPDQKKLPRKQNLEGGKRPPRGEGAPAGARSTGGQSNQEIKRQMLAQQGGGTPGQEVRDAVAGQDRSRGRLVSMKIDGSKEDVAATLAFMKQWTAQDPTVELVSPRELLQRVAPPTVSVQAKAAAQAVLEAWSDGPADTLSVGGSPLSQADAFEVMARHLAGGGERITTTNVLGPLGAASSLVQGRGKVTDDEVRAAAAAAVKAIDESPHHAMPVTVQVGGTTVGFHQLHWLMARVVAEGDEKLEVPEAAYAPPFADWLADRLGRDDPDSAFWMECQYWTIKPAVFR